MAVKKSPTSAKESSAQLGFEAKLWLAADKLRNNMDAAEYKHVVLGLIFLKYISDSFEEHHTKLVAGNLSWHEKPKKNITSWMKPRTLLKGAHDEKGFAQWYQGFPPSKGLRL